MVIEQKELEVLAQKYFNKSFNYDWVGISSIVSFYSLFSEKSLYKVLETDREFNQLYALHCVPLGEAVGLKIKCANSLKSLFEKIGFSVNIDYVIENWAKAEIEKL